MSAFGTKKPLGDAMVQLGFPQVFEDVYARAGPRPSYISHEGADSTSGGESDSGSESDEGMENLQLPLPVGRDIQDRYHEQKRLDANHMAMAGVHARRMSDYRANRSHNGYFGMPKPVLGQRKFANPSNGNQADIYAARNDLRGGGTVMGAGDCYETQLRGGVLRTAQGQAYGKKKLMERIGQLDTISNNKAAFVASMPTQEAPPTDADISQGLPENAGKNTMLELNSLLQQIADAVYGGLESINRYSLGDLTRALSLLFRIAAIANEEELDDLTTLFATLKDSEPEIRSQIRTEENKPPAEARRPLIETGFTMISLIDKTYQYLKTMLANVNKSPRERSRVSSALVKDLKFAKLGRLGVKAIKSMTNPPDVPPPRRRFPGERDDNAEPDADEGDSDDDDGDGGVAEAAEDAEADDEEDEEDAGGSTAGEDDETGEDDELSEDDDDDEDEDEEEEEEESEEGDTEEVERAKAEFEQLDAFKNGIRKVWTAYAQALDIHTGPALTFEKMKARAKATRLSGDYIDKPLYVPLQNPNSRGLEGRWYILGEKGFGPVGKDAKGKTTYGESLKFVPPLRGKKAMENRLAELKAAADLGGEGHMRGGAEEGQRQTREARPAERTFTFLPLPSDRATQLESAHRQGLNLDQVKYSRDERNVFAKKSGAYMGEELPEGGENVITYNKYPTLKASGMAKAMRRETKEPTFAGGYTPSSLKKKLGAGQNYTGFRDEGKLGVYNGQPKSGGGFFDDVKKEGKKLYNMGRYAINPIATSIRDAKHLYAQRYTPQNLPKERTWGEYFSGKGKMTRADLPKTRDGFVKLAEELKGHGRHIRVNSGSDLKNIRQNFIKKLGL